MEEMRKEERSKSYPTAEKAVGKTVNASERAKATWDKGKEKLREERNGRGTCATLQYGAMRRG